MTTAFDRAAARPVITLPNLQRLPLRAIGIGGAAAAAIVAGAMWIAAPGSSVSTDDAYVKADSTIVAPRVQGLIAEILVRDNQTVTAGQPLVRIDPEDYQQTQNAAQADVAFAEAALAQQSAQLALASANSRAPDPAIPSADSERARAEARPLRFQTLAPQGSVA